MKKSVGFLLSLILIFSFAQLAQAFEQDFKNAQLAYQNKEYEKAGKLFEKVGNELIKSKNTDGANKVYANAGIAYLQGEHYDTAAKLYEKLLKNPNKLALEQRKKLFQNLAFAYTQQDKNALAVNVLNRTLKFVTKQNNDFLSNIHAELGDAYLRLELYPLAEEHFIKASGLLAKNSKPEVRAKILTALGLCQGNLGKFNLAVKNLNDAYTIAKKLKEPLTQAESSSNLGILHWERGEYDKALKLLNNSLEIEKTNDLMRNESVDSNNLGLVQKSIGNYDSAMNLFRYSYELSKKTKNRRDEAIALVNLALLNRMTSNLSQAKKNYSEAIAIFKEIDFKEGLAGALLGVGKMIELEDRNYIDALKNYQEALDIYTKISLPRSIAESLLQIGHIYKVIAIPTRLSRDLVFEDEPVFPQIEKNKSIELAREAFTKALEIALQVSSKEMTWAAYQGLGYCDFREGKLDHAFGNYQNAIQIVTSIQASLTSVQLLGEYMAGKEDLYSEAMQVCAALYEKTNDKKYLTEQLSLDETLRNEVQKASSALLQMKFEDPKKQELYVNLMQLGKEQEKAAKNIATIPALNKDATADEKQSQALKESSVKKQKEYAKKLDEDYKKLLAQWKKYYPEDQVIFDSNARVDISKVQKSLNNEQVMLQYISLPDKLLILVVKKDAVHSYVVNVTQAELDETIRKEFLVDYIEGYRDRKTAPTEKEGLEIATKLFSKFNSWLIEPIKAELENTKRIYVVTSGFLSALPFGAIVTDVQDEKPHFLIEDFDIAYVRPSFIESLAKQKVKNPKKKLLAVGNPRNTTMSLLPTLEGAVEEVKYVSNAIKHANLKDVEYENNASESWFINNLKNNSYETVYFATHGMPYSEVYHMYHAERQNYLETLKKSKNKYIAETRVIDENLKTHSPLNGYLYMATKGDGSDNGLLTIKKILELPNSLFKDTRYAFLSACNTGVTFAPKSLGDDSIVKLLTSSKEAEKEARKAGWIPGVDQISFVEPFMRRGLDNVYGTLWFADDAASSHILRAFTDLFMKDKRKADIVATYSTTLRNYLSEARKNKQILSDEHFEPTNPFYWAVGAIFGK